MAFFSLLALSIRSDCALNVLDAVGQKVEHLAEVVLELCFAVRPKTNYILRTMAKHKQERFLLVTLWCTYVLGVQATAVVSHTSRPIES